MLGFGRAMFRVIQVHSRRCGWCWRPQHPHNLFWASTVHQLLNGILSPNPSSSKDVHPITIPTLQMRHFTDEVQRS